MGGGNRGNVLVDYDINAGVSTFDYIGLKNETQGILKKTLTCKFYLNETFQFESPSARIQTTDAGLSEIGPIQIECPNVPEMYSSFGGQKWDSMSLERDVDQISKPVNPFTSCY